MFKLGRTLGLGLLARRVVRELAEVRAQLTRQNDLLERLADKFAPVTPQTDPRDVAATTGVDYLDATESMIALDYIARTETDTGHRPSDEEVLSYLADEKTVDLHARLIERERELERARADRRGAI